MSDEIPSASDAGFAGQGNDEVIIKVLGVGGGGNNAVSHMYRQDIKNVSFAVLNTDRKQLNLSPVPNRVLIGNGLGAGNMPEVAKEAAEEASDRIAEIFNDNTKMVFITAGMGGGTGTGAAPVVARIARERGLLTIGIVTIPFLFEGKKKIVKAVKGASEMSKYVDAMLIINNQRLNEIYPDINLVNAFGKADDTLTTAARSISELINSEDPHINLDFNDVNTTLRNGGAAIISTGFGEGENRVTSAINDALNSPLLKNRDIMSSKHLLFNLFFNPDVEDEFQLKQSETDELTSFVSSIDDDVDVIWGMAYDRSLGHKVKITILASGFDVTIDDNTVIKSNPDSGTVKFGNPKDAAAADTDQMIRGEYGDAALENMEKERQRKRCIVLTPSQMDDDAFIDAFEKSPAYNRDQSTASEIRKLGQTARHPEAPSTPDGHVDRQRPVNGSDTVIKFG